MSIVDITSGVTYDTISDAVTGSAAGDTIRIDAGTYAEDIPKLRHALTLEGVGAVTLAAPAAGLANDEGILVVDAAVTVQGISFTGATGPSGNDAGIRFETGSLTVEDCSFSGNQDGLLANADAGATISIDHSNFYDNGTGTGTTHNLYVDEVGTLSVTNSTFSDALGGHEIKSRADNTIITGNTLNDGTADTSYSIDLPNGGHAVITGNSIVKGANASNNFVMQYGGEGSADPVSPSLTVVYANSSLQFDDNTVTSLLPADHNHPLLLDQAGDGDGNTIVPEMSGNTFINMPASQLVYGLLGGSMQYWPAALVQAGEVFVACFHAGTRIATPQGEIDVDALREGDLVVTLTHGVRPIVWIGRRHYSAAQAKAWPQVRPIRIVAGALGPGVPHRDLLLSPEHALYLAGMLVPVRLLVNETSIRSDGATGPIDYVHIELDLHAAVLAEGAATESFVDLGSRAGFDNAPAAAPLRSDTVTLRSCAPRVLRGARLDVIRRRIDARAQKETACPAGAGVANARRLAT